MGPRGLILDLQIVLHRHCSLGMWASPLQRTRGRGEASTWLGSSTDQDLGVSSRNPWVFFLVCSVRPAPYTAVMHLVFPAWKQALWEWVSPWWG